MRRRLNPKDRLVEILAATKEVLGQQGYYHITVPKINEAAGIAQGTFYRYFQSADDALLALIKQALESLYRKGAKIDFMVIKTPQVLVRELTSFYTHMGEQLLSQHVVFREISVIDRRHPSKVAHYLSQYDNKVFANILATSKAIQGKPPFREFDPLVVSTLIFGMVKGAIRELLFSPQPIQVTAWARELARFEAGALLDYVNLDEFLRWNSGSGSETGHTT